MLILGGGRVGQAIASVLAKRNIAHCIVEQLPELVQASSVYVIGNAEEEDVLRTAGIMEAPAVVTTTHDDDLNVYLTLLCRHLRPDIQILSRAALERNTPMVNRWPKSLLNVMSPNPNVVMTVKVQYNPVDQL